MNIYTLGIDDLNTNANTTKEALLYALERDGLLTKKAEEIAANYTVVVHKKGWLGRLFDKLAKEPSATSDLVVTVLKRV